MLTIGTPVETRTRFSGLTVASILLHLCVFGALLYHRTPWIAPMRLPGTALGSNLVINYFPGRAVAQTSMPHPKTKPQITTATALPLLPVPHHQDPTPSPNPQSPASLNPDSAVGNDALGTGNVKIASSTFSPSPRPDLSALPHGTHGDVILDIVIDSTGNISDIKKVRGLGPSVDDSVIATVQHWTFHPATKDGQPVASEQELLFHYEA
jgi:protein TonB